MAQTQVKPTIVAENLGPIGRFELCVEGFGVTVVHGVNGAGKSILAGAIKSAQRGSGSVPLKDHAKRGKVAAFGANITIGGTCRHTGETDRPNIEGKFDIGALIEPPFKGDKERNAAGIKALLALTGKAADPQAFRSHEALSDFATVVKVESLETNDFVEMARRIKKDYDNKAKELEAEAEREDGFAAGLQSQDEIDLNAECDEGVLQAAYDSARDDVTRLENARDNYDELQKDADKAKEQLAKLRDIPTESLDAIHADMQENVAEKTRLENEIEDLQKQLEAAKSNLKTTDAAIQSLTERENAVLKHQESIDATESILNLFAARSCPSNHAISTAKEALTAAQAANSQGALIRQAKIDAASAAEHREKASDAREKALKFRDAGKATDEVLSSAIECPYLRVESDGKSAVLVTDNDRGKGIPFYELSDGQRGKIAIQIASDRLSRDGTSGALVIEQRVWEGVDSWNRKEINDEAVRLEQYVLAMEATRELSVEIGIRRVELKSE